MTSANLSLTKNQAGQDQPGSRIPTGQNARGPVAWHKGILSRRIWTLGLTILYLVTYYLIGTVMIITRSNYRAMLANYSEAATLSQRLYEVSKWIGLRQNFWMIPALLGILLGIEGFSYLFSMVKMDFYESQPMPRRLRFRRMYLNGVLIFTVPYVIAAALAMLIAAGMGGMTGLLFTEVLVATVQILFVFLVSYTVAVFAVMLSGNTAIAVIVTGIVMCSEYIYSVALQALTYTFFHTYYYSYANTASGIDIAAGNWFKISPIHRIDDLMEEIDRIDSWRYVPFSAEEFGEALRDVVISDIGTLIIGIVFLVAAFALYKRRRAEAAGDTVIYPIARWILKSIVVIGGALFLGIEVIYGVINEISGDQNVISLLTIVAMLAVVVILSGIIQGIYDMNPKRFLAKLWQAGICAVVVAGVFAIYRYDLVGYDSYLPAVSDVAYASFVSYGNSDYAFEDPAEPGTRLDANNYSMNYMQLTDIYTVEQIAQIGMAVQVTNSNSVSSDDYINGWPVGVVYTLNNGKKVARQLTIPYDIDSDLMDRIVGSKEYKAGFFPVYQENNQYLASKQANSVLTYTNGQDQRNGDASLYEEFCAAYRKDLEQFNYSYATSHYPVGAVVYNMKEDGYTSAESILQVYPDYTNTIQFLKDHDMYVEAVEVSETVARIEVDHYTDYGCVTEYYTDPDQIKMILQSSVPSGITRLWDKGDGTEISYSINTSSDRPQDDAYYTSRDFRIGEIPQFVINDVGAPEEEESNAAMPAVAAQEVTIDAR